jgi:dihydrofolate reductase
MTMTVNGYIAKENDDTSFVSDIEWNNFKIMINKVSNMIIGSRTYEIVRSNDELKNLDSIKVVVVTNNDSFKVSNPNHLIANSPKEALSILEKQGFNEALVAGGGKLNASFASENLIDEIYLDIEPIVFGRGIKLFAEKDFEAKLKLLETKELSADEIQLHYKVLK